MKIALERHNLPVPNWLKNATIAKGTKEGPRTSASSSKEVKAEPKRRPIQIEKPPIPRRKQAQERNTRTAKEKQEDREKNKNRERLQRSESEFWRRRKGSIAARA